MRNSSTHQRREIVLGISGSSGITYGVRLLKALRELGITTHLVLTASAVETLKYETSLSPKEVTSLASFHYEGNDFAAPVASGTYITNGMVVAPCSMKTLAGIAQGYSDSLLLRAADVTLKEHRPLVVVPREAPLSIIHLENMLKLAQAGGIIVPASPGFYHRPKTIDDLVDHVVGKVLDVLGIEHSLFARWGVRKE